MGEMGENTTAFHRELANEDDESKAAPTGNVPAKTEPDSGEPYQLTLPYGDSFRHIFDTLLEGCLIFGFDWRCLYANDAAARFERRQKSDLIGKTILELHPGIENAETYAILQQCMTNRAGRTAELVFTSPNGSIAWFESRIQPVPEGLLILSLDISDRKQDADHIQKLYRTLSVLTDINQAIIRIRQMPALLETACQIAVEKGGFLMAWVGLLDQNANRVNPIAHFGRAEHYLDKLNIILDDSPRGWGPTATAIRTGRITITNDIEHDPSMAPSRTDALQLGYRAMATLPLKVKGEVQGALSLYRDKIGFFDEDEILLLEELAEDISFAMEIADQEVERRQALEALSASEERYRRFIEDQDELICRYDMDFRLTFANRAYGESFKTTPESLLGTSILDRIPDAEREAARAYVQALNAENPSSITEHRSIMPDGSLRWFQWTDRALLDAEGRIIEYQGVGRDITSRKQQDLLQMRLSQVLESIASDQPLAQVLDELVRTIEAYQPEVRASVLLFDPVEQRLHHGAAPHLPAPYNAAVDGIQIGPAVGSCGTAAYNKKLIVVEDIQASPLWADFHELAREHGLRACWSQPIMDYRNDVLGTFALYYAKPHSPAEDELELITLAAHVAGIAIRRSQAEAALRKANDTLEHRVVERTREMQDAKEQVEAILNNSLDGILLADADLIIRRANAAFNRQLACEAEPCYNQSLLDLFCDESRAAMLESVWAARQDSSDQKFEALVCRKDETTFEAEIGIRQIAGDGFVCTIHDISQRKRAEEALRESEQKLRLMIEGAPEGIIISDSQGQITLVNAEAMRIFACPREMLIGKPVEILVPEPLRQTHFQHRSGSQSEVLRRRLGATLEVFAQRTDGTLFPAAITVNTVPTRDELMTISFVADITERRRAEDELKQSEERFRQIADNFDQILVIRSGDDKQVLYVNRMYEAMWGRPAESLYQNPDSFMETVHPEDQERVSNLFRTRRYVEEGLSDLEYRIIAPDQQIRWVHVRTFPIKNEDGSILRRAGVVEDITRRKRYEETLERALKQQKELNDLKSRFVSMASHEFRTPLATILALTETLSAYRHKLSEEQVEQRLGKIKEQLDYLKDIMEDMLLLSRMQARRAEFNPRSVDIDALCRSLLDEFQSQPDFGHQIIYHPGIIPREAWVDEKLFRQIVGNLVSNAIKYSSADKPVTIALDYEDEALLVRVSDLGIGIPEADLPYLFEPFHRASNVGMISGTGLGLVITKESVELHGGTISVDTTVGRGTTFTVGIPQPSENNEADLP